MTTSIQCPVSKNKVSVQNTRIIATIVVLSVIATLYSNFWLIPAFLAFDFLQRGFYPGSFSITARIAQNISTWIGFNHQYVSAAPKIFAAQIGFLFSLSILLTVLLKFTTLTLILGSMLGICATLEAVFSICVGCHLYTLLKKLKVLS